MPDENLLPPFEHRSRLRTAPALYRIERIRVAAYLLWPAFVTISLIVAGIAARLLEVERKLSSHGGSTQVMARFVLVFRDADGERTESRDTAAAEPTVNGTLITEGAGFELYGKRWLVSHHDGVECDRFLCTPLDQETEQSTDTVSRIVSGFDDPLDPTSDLAQAAGDYLSAVKGACARAVAIARREHMTPDQLFEQLRPYDEALAMMASRALNLELQQLGRWKEQVGRGDIVLDDSPSLLGAR